MDGDDDDDDDDDADDDDDDICRENQNTRFLFDNFFPLENLAVCEIMWKNIVQPDRSQMTIWRMFIACWIPKATNIHLEHAFPLS
jgi:hypothetical protein